MERFQCRPARLFRGIPLFARVNHFELLVGAGPSFLKSQRECALVVLRHQLFTRKVPSHLEKVNMPRRTTVYKLRRHRTTFIPTAHTSAHCDSVIQSLCTPFIAYTQVPSRNQIPPYFQNCCHDALRNTRLAIAHAHPNHFLTNLDVIHLASNHHKTPLPSFHFNVVMSTSLSTFFL